MRAAVPFCCLILTGALGTPPAGSAQSVALLRTERPTRATKKDVPTAGASVAGGAFLGLAGLLAGGVVGAAVVPCSGDFCGLAPALVGAALGETVGMAVGVHAGNGRSSHFGGRWSHPTSLSSRDEIRTLGIAIP